MKRREREPDRAHQLCSVTALRSQTPRRFMFCVRGPLMTLVHSCGLLVDAINWSRISAENAGDSQPSGVDFVDVQRIRGRRCPLIASDRPLMTGSASWTPRSFG